MFKQDWFISFQDIVYTNTFKENGQAQTAAANILVEPREISICLK